MDGAKDADWDAIIVGTGLGGATAGARLAQAGLRVLFLERGHGEMGASDPTPLEQLYADVTLDHQRAVRMPTTVAAVGGTSLVYAASLERPERHDIDDIPDLSHPTGGWPVGYDALAPYYERVERMMSVVGEPDPLGQDDGLHLRPPSPLSAGDMALAGAMRRGGLNPYRTHVGIRYDADCAECIGRECLRGCKADARSVGLTAALATGRATIRNDCRVTRLLSDGARITGVEAIQGGAPVTLRAKRVVLAAGALSSAQLLLASTSESWPDGVANRSGLVGRNVMFHLSERFAIWPPGRAALGIPAKSLAFRDLYRRGSDRFGVVQSMGLQADYGNLLMHLYGKFDRSRAGRLRPLRGLLRIPAKAAALGLGNARVFVGILEDLPYPDNRVEPGDDATGVPRLSYTIAPELAARRQAFRALLRDSLRGQRWFFLHTEPEVNFGHACGTARFGTDARTSVLNADCRAHGVDNLWVVDSSFMPTSTGVNPGLTIAANSLRVADIIAERH